MTTDHEHNGDGRQVVLPGDECPRCGEDDADRLVWLDDERVRCAGCGTVYEPGREAGT
jgi:uncharacterized Zn finger protein